MPPIKIRVTTKPGLYEERKRQMLAAGYCIEEEQRVPINGLCSFTAIKEAVGLDDLDSLGRCSQPD